MHGYSFAGKEMVARGLYGRFFALGLPQTNKLLNLIYTLGMPFVYKMIIVGNKRRKLR